jgi:hypothetical protein
MKPGDKLLRDLEDAGKSQAELGRACSKPVSPTTVGRWIDGLNNDTITNDQWRKMLVGVRRVGLDPESYKILPPPADVTLDGSLLPLVDKFSREQLKDLQAILEASENARASMLFVVKALTSVDKRIK